MSHSSPPDDAPKILIKPFSKLEPPVQQAIAQSFRQHEHRLNPDLISPPASDWLRVILRIDPRIKFNFTTHSVEILEEDWLSYDTLLQAQLYGRESAD